MKIWANRPGVDTCVPALKDSDPSVRLDAVNDLKWLRDTGAVEPLLSLLNDSEIQVRWAAIHTLGLLNDRRAVQPLMALLSDGDVLNRWAAALALGRLGAKEALKPLVGALGDENNLVRMMAARAVGYLKDPGLIISQLRGLLTDSDPMVVRAARQALSGAKAERRIALRLLEILGGPTAFLKRPLNSVTDIRSRPWIERLFHRPAVPGEKIHFGPAQHWLGRQWDLRIGSINGVVYKIALEASPADQEDAVELSTRVFTTVQNFLGTPAEQHGLYIWDADDGNVVLQIANVAGDRRVMVFFTSSIVRTLAKN